MKKKRVVYRVIQSKASGDWAISKDGTWMALATSKIFAVKIARAFARAHHARGELTQVVVHKVNGKIQYENTYGADPKRRKG